MVVWMASSSKSAVARTGCIWDSKQPPLSDQTRNLLKEFMQESRLTFAQQRKLKESVDKNGSLPSKLAHGNKPKKPVRSTKSSGPKVISSGMRTRSQIVESGDLVRPRYRPTPAAPVRTDKDKERLAFIMAYGAEPDEGNKKIPDDFDLEDIGDEEEIDRFDELVKEIEERKQFLSQMADVGQDKKYRTVIETEISQKLREMEVIDKKRSNQITHLQ